MKISVIIPTYCPGDYLTECLNSLYCQTFPKEDYEIILVLNGCYEPYNTFIIQYINAHPQLNWRYEHTDNGGVSNARNIALDICRGEYITFIDDDDYVSPMYLEELYKNVNETTISLCFPLAFVDGSNDAGPFYITKDYLKFKHKQNLKYYYPRRYFGGPVYKLIHRNIIGDRRFDIRFSKGEDSLFMFLISNAFCYVSFTSENAVYFRRFRSNSVTMRKTSLFNTMFNSIRLIREYCRIYFKNIPNYSFRFFSSRIFSSIKTIIFEVVLKIKYFIIKKDN